MTAGCGLRPGPGGLAPAAGGSTGALTEVEFTALQRLAVGGVLGSISRFWSLSRLAPGQTIRTLLADRILDARLTPCPDGGHIWLDDFDPPAGEIADFIARTEPSRPE